MFEYLAISGSVASLIGLVIAFPQTRANRGKVRELEVRIERVQTSANVRTEAHASGSAQQAKQTVSDITQSVNTGEVGSIPQAECPHLEGDNKQIGVSTNPQIGGGAALCPRLLPATLSGVSTPMVGDHWEVDGIMFVRVTQ